MRQHFALEDLNDVRDAELLVAFTESPRSSASRGGRHVELGYALALNKLVAVVGPRENVFCWLPEVRGFMHWDHLMDELVAGEIHSAVSASPELARERGE